MSVSENSKGGRGQPDGGLMGEESAINLSHAAGRAECSILVATYNRPDSLRLLLKALNIQTAGCFEVIVCDDGSAPETLEMLTAVSTNLRFDVRYVRHEDKGFRKARILNRGVLASKTDYLLFLDDDCIPHSRYVENHLRQKSPGTLVFGKFVRVRPELTGLITEDVIEKRGLENPPFFTFKKKMGLQMNRFRFYRHLLKNSPLRPKLYGANFAVDKPSLYAVNGFNEAFEGWGYEDNELRLRLVNYGIKMREVITRAIVSHLVFHENRKLSQSRSGLSNKDLFLSRRNEKWATRGLDDGQEAIR